MNEERVKEGDCSGPRSAALILNNDHVEFAVLECARGGILRSGLAFDVCNISVITNVSEDHLGLADIENIAQLARVKSVVALSTFNEGYAVLNADDPQVLSIRRQLGCRAALFALEGTNGEIRSHTDSGGTAAFVSEGSIVLVRNSIRLKLIEVKDVPLSFDGTSDFMVQNVLAATLAVALSGVNIESIVEGLRTFFPSVKQTPGRLNLFELKKGKLIVDYVHNPGGYLVLKPFIRKQKETKKTGIIYATGDRRPEDIKLIGSYAGEMFDQIVINNEHDARGVPASILTAQLIEGIRSVNKSVSIKILPGELEALDYAIRHAGEDELVFASVNNISRSLEFIEDFLRSDIANYG